jgi:hypothetical protein
MNESVRAAVQLRGTEGDRQWERTAIAPSSNASPSWSWLSVGKSFDNA